MIFAKFLSFLKIAFFYTSQILLRKYFDFWGRILVASRICGMVVGRICAIRRVLITVTPLRRQILAISRFWHFPRRCLGNFWHFYSQSSLPSKTTRTFPFEFSDSDLLGKDGFGERNCKFYSNLRARIARCWDILKV